MSDDRNSQPVEAKPAQPEKRFEDLPPAAQRALKEAEGRRRERDTALAKSPPAKEINGRGGLDPARYEDWEVKGIAVDF
ncbi:DUF1674 domain-containing protein [Coralliovum pocilloporae]|uniref:DUF1674 domain-containing protein n=1 Tax=Coralliovum pocilloporae TaxID=3066369 RepID=UPI0033073B98